MAEGKAAEKDATAAVGSVWELDARKGTHISIERPDGRVVTASRSLHVLDIPGEYIATAGDNVQKVTAK
jgi:hypothetical protein